MTVLFVFGLWLILKPSNNDNLSSTSTDEKRGISPVIWRKLQTAMSDNTNFTSELNRRYNVTDLKAFAFALGDTQAYKETFLRPAFDIRSFQDGIQQDMISFVEETRGRGLDYFEQREKELLKRMQERKTLLANQQMRLLITHSVTDLAIGRELISSVFAHSEPFKYGTLHLAVGVGDLVLEWGCGLCGKSLVCPSKTSELSKLLLSVNVQNDPLYAHASNFLWSTHRAITHNYYAYNDADEHAQMVKETRPDLIATYEAYLDKVAQACVEFNRARHYDVLTSNCQQFSHHLFATVGVETDLKEEGDQSRHTGLADVVIEIARRGQCSFRFGQRRLRTRTELDEFVMRQVDFASLTDNEKRLLFAYKNIYDHYRTLDASDTRMATSEAAQAYWTKLVNEFYFV